MHNYKHNQTILQEGISISKLIHSCEYLTNECKPATDEVRYNFYIYYYI